MPRTHRSALLLLLLAGAAQAYDEAVRREVVDGGVHVPVLTKAPSLLHFVQAPYPAQAEREHRMADVRLVVTLNADGTVGEAHLAGPPVGFGFDEAALAAIKQFRFSPAEVDGVPAPIQLQYVYRFVLLTPQELPKPLPPTATLMGRVLVKGSRYRVPGATVVCGEGEDAPHTVSDADGDFSLVVPAGDCRVRVVAQGYATLTTSERLGPHERREVRYYLSRTASSYETVVRGMGEQKEVVKRTFDRQEIQTVPGTFGDPLRVIQDFPGVARAPFISGALIVRGASPDETQTFVDGVPIPILYHLGLGPSVINAQFLDDIDFYPGGFGARYGRAIGGVVDVTTRKGAADTLHGEAKVDVMDTAAFLEAPVTDGISVAGAIRRSYVDTTLPLALRELGASNTLVVLPVYWDYQVRADFGAPRNAPAESKRSTFYVMAFGSNDYLKVAASGTGLERTVNLDVHDLFHRVKGDWTFHEGNLTSVFAPWLGYDLADFGFGSSAIKAQMFEAGGREDLTLRLSRAWTVRTGLDVYSQRLSGTAMLPPLPRTQYNNFPGASPQFQNQSLAAIATGFDGAVYAESDYKVGRFTVTPGLRASLQREQGHDLNAIDPRLWLRYDLDARTAVKGSVGLYSQAPNPADMEHPPLGSPTLVDEHAFQTSLGVEHAFTNVISLDVTGYFNRRYSLVEPDRTRTLNPDGTITYQPFSNGGLGKAYGLELLLRHQVTAHFYGWLAYTLNRSVISTPFLPQEHLANYDETHILTLVASYKLPWDFEVGVRYRYVTGRPYTPRLHPYDQYSADANAYSGVGGDAYSARYDDFSQLDVRVERSFVFTNWTLSVYLDVQNVTNSTNEEALLYDYRFRATTPVPGIPILPVLGVRGSF